MTPASRPTSRRCAAKAMSLQPPSKPCRSRHERPLSAYPVLTFWTSSDRRFLANEHARGDRREVNDHLFVNASTKPPAGSSSIVATASDELSLYRLSLSG